MRGKGVYDVLKQNMQAVGTHLASQRKLHGRLRMCWKCQKDKSPLGGHIKAQIGLCKFICKDCLEAKGKQAEGNK